jgi:hypothetical protein
MMFSFLDHDGEAPTGGDTPTGAAIGLTTVYFKTTPDND